MTQKTAKKYAAIATPKIEREADRQRQLKDILVGIQNGAQLNPAIFKIERLYSDAQDWFY